MVNPTHGELWYGVALLLSVALAGLLAVWCKRGRMPLVIPLAALALIFLSPYVSLVFGSLASAYGFYLSRSSKSRGIAS